MPVEREGVVRAARAREVADLMFIVIDSGEALDRRGSPPAGVSSTPRSSWRAKPIANRSGIWTVPFASRRSRSTGIDGLRRCDALRRLTNEERLRDPAAISNLRHVLLLKEARATLMRACAAIAESAPEEFVLVDLQRARASLAKSLVPVRAMRRWTTSSATSALASSW